MATIYEKQGRRYVVWGTPSATSPTSCAVSFWRELWPMFTQALREELAAECAPATPRPRSTN